jgi:hypothetical protein
MDFRSAIDGFASGTSLEFFLDQPQVNMQRAWAGWRKLTAQQR